MKRVLKIVGIIIGILVILFTFFSVWAVNDVKEEEKLAKSNIDNEIAFEGEFSSLDMSKDWIGEHIVVSGVIDNVDKYYFTIANGDLVFKAYCDDMAEDILKEGTVIIDGVCTYQSSSNITIRNGRIVDYKKPVVATISEDDSVAADKTNASQEAKSEQKQTVDKKETSRTESKQDKVEIESEWYKNSSLYMSDSQDKLELIWYDDKGIDIAINDTMMYHFDSTKYQSTSEGNAEFVCDDGTEFIYNPNENIVELKNGIHKGIYMSAEDVEEQTLKDIKEYLIETLGEDTFKSVGFSRKDTLEIKVYFERKSILISTDKLKKSVLDTAYMTLKEYYEYMQEDTTAPVNVLVTACFPDDGKEHADEDCYQVLCIESDFEKFDFTSSYTSQMEDYAYVSKWLIGIR